MVFWGRTRIPQRFWHCSKPAGNPPANLIPQSVIQRYRRAEPRGASPLLFLGRCDWGLQEGEPVCSQVLRRRVDVQLMLAGLQTQKSKEPSCLQSQLECPLPALARAAASLGLLLPWLTSVMVSLRSVITYMFIFPSPEQMTSFLSRDVCLSHFHFHHPVNVQSVFIEWIKISASLRVRWLLGTVKQSVTTILSSKGEGEATDSSSSQPSTSSALQTA